VREASVSSAAAASAVSKPRSPGTLMSAASALMLATEASRSVAARRRFILEEGRIRLKSCVVFEIYKLYGIEHGIEHVLVMVYLGLARAERVGGGRLTTGCCGGRLTTE
jgi:hypothetical protein